MTASESRAAQALDVVPRPRLLKAGLIVTLGGVYLGFDPWTTWPWVEPRMAVMAAGCVLLLFSGIRLNRRLAGIAGLWVGVSGLAALTGVDVMRSVVGREGEGAGLTLLVICAFLLLVGAALPRSSTELVARLSVWLGIAVSMLAFAAWVPGGPLRAVAPFLQELLTLNANGATMGNGLWLAGALAVSLAALLQTGQERSPLAFYPMLIALALGLGVARQTSSLALPALVVICWAWKRRPRPAFFWAVTAVLAVTIGSFFSVRVASVTGGEEIRGSSTDALVKLRVAGVNFEAAMERPLTGWGPGNGGSAFMHTTTPAVQETNGVRYFADAHNIFLQTMVTTGILGLLAFLFLAVEVIPGVISAPTELGWVVGGVAALGALLCYEPISVQAMPLVFLLAGIGNSRRELLEDAPTLGKSLRALVAGLLVVSLGLALVGVTSSTLLRYGVTDGSEWALRAAMSVEPWRQETVDSLASYLAFGRGPDAGGTNPREALAIVRDLIAEKPWDPEVRIPGIRIAWKAGDRAQAEAWAKEQLERFPGDRGFLVDAIRDGLLPPVTI